MKKLQDEYATNPRAACRKALARTRKLPVNERMEAINSLLGMHGVEAIRGEWQNGYWCDIVATYCNTGDTYDTTVLHVRGDWSGARSRFIISNWGDWVEKNGAKNGVR